MRFVSLGLAGLAVSLLASPSLVVARHAPPTPLTPPTLGARACIMPGHDVIIRGVVRGTGRGPILTTGFVHARVVGGVPMGGSAAIGKDGSYEIRFKRYDTTMTVTVNPAVPGYTASSVNVIVRPGSSDTVNLPWGLAPLPRPDSVTTFTGKGAVGGTARGVVGGPPPPRGMQIITHEADFTGKGVVGGTAKSVIGGTAPGDPQPGFNTEEYNRVDENPFLAVSSNPLSTFSIDVDRASYSNVRRFICEGTLPPKDAVRIEELINYFPYAYARPAGSDPIALSADIAAAPWNPTHRIVRVALQTTPIETADLPPSNLVFLLDVSGSMYPENRLPLVKKALRLLVDQLRPIDRVAIVVYAGAAGEVLPSTPASEKATILAALDRLEAGGSTAGGAGIRLAYDVARANFMPRGNNRVILATDGDFNIGVSNTSELIELIEARRTEGTFLTVLGFGMGNIKDGRLEQLADKGNGNYAYVDDIAEARKVFVQEMGATLVAVAKDVKLQVEFNPTAVQAYRLIGYENRVLRTTDFTDDRKDAGEIGAGHSVTALYEIVPAGRPLDVDVGSVPPLRYQTGAPAFTSASGELLTVSLRYKPPTSDTSRLMQRAVGNAIGTPDADFRFAMSVAAYGMLLRASPHRGAFSYAQVASLARDALGNDPERYRSEFVRMVERTEMIGPRTR